MSTALPQCKTLREEIAAFSQLKHEPHFSQKTRCPCCLSDDIRADYFSKFGFAYSLCRACEFLFLNPSPSEGAIELLYNGAFYTNVRRYLEAHRAEKSDYASNSLDRGEADSLIRRTLAVLPPGKSAASWLDFGGGIGSFLNLVRQLVPALRASLCESNRFSAEFARRRYDLRVIDRLAAERFDVISLIAVLEHVTEPRGLLQALRGALADDGLLLLLVPQMPKLVRRRSRQEYTYVLPPYHVSLFNEDNLVALVRDLGFVPVDVWQSGPPAFAWEHLLTLHHKYDTAIPEQPCEQLKALQSELSTVERVTLRGCHLANRLTVGWRKRHGQQLLHLIAKRAAASP